MSITSLRGRMRPLRFIIAFAAMHVFCSAGVAWAFVWRFRHRELAAIAHVLLVTEWEATILLAVALCLELPSSLRRRAPYVYALIAAPAVALQLHLYVLNLFSNSFWSKNITYQLVRSFAPSVLSGKEPLPFGRASIGMVALGLMALSAAAVVWPTRRLRQIVEAVPDRSDRRKSPVGLIAACLASAALLCGTVRVGIASDWLFWNTEMIVSFFRSNTVIFEPTPRRNAIGDWDEQVRASYPHIADLANVAKRNVVLIVVDSLRADHMGVYGYERPTTPFLSRLVATGRMRKITLALSTCSESYCGITSLLSAKEFRDISPRNFKLHDVLHDLGWQSRFILSGNHLAWYNLSQFYGGVDMVFDGSLSQQYPIDDDRVVFEGLDRVPDSQGVPTFFYIHLMSTHYSGIQLAAYHTYTRPEDTVDPGLNPHEIFPLLDKPDRYDDKVMQADDLIRQVFERLQRKHYLDDALVVVTGDHGEGLGERHFGHGWYLYEEDIRIPLLIYDDPAVRYANLDFATQVDVAPTILDRLGLPVPASWEGRSLLNPDTARVSFHQTYFDPLRYAVVSHSPTGTVEYITSPTEHVEELYDLTPNAGGRRDLIAGADAALLDDVRAKFRQHFGDGTEPDGAIVAGVKQ